jgi:uncharacterized protein (TIGR03663 family)
MALVGLAALGPPYIRSLSPVNEVMRTRWLSVVGITLVLGTAAAYRLPLLDRRPMHADEACQAWRASELQRTGEYRYDVRDHHGPSLYWLTRPVLAVRHDTWADSVEQDYRIVPALAGIAAVGLVFLLAGGLGRWGALTAAFLAAVSPAMVFYSRYYIQEMLLVFFMLLTLAAAWRFARTERWPWLILAGVGLGMMHATKETWILAGVAAVAAAMATAIVAGVRRVPVSKRLAVRLLAVFAIAAAVAFAFYSGFRLDWHDPWRSLVAYVHYVHRGTAASEHFETWYYYLHVLFAWHPSRHVFWSEGLIAALAVVGAVYAFAARRSSDPNLSLPLVRFLAMFTLGLTLLYSLIPYKTPWCVLSFLAGMILLAGVGATVIVRLLPGKAWKAAAVVVLVLAAGQLARQSCQLNFNPRYWADPANPYVYAHTPNSLPRLAGRLERLAARVPGGRDLLIQVVESEDYWPLPWYLRGFHRVGYWLDPAAWQKWQRHGPRPDIAIVTTDVDPARLAALLPDYHAEQLESLRPGVFVYVAVRPGLWPAYVDAAR